MAGETKSDGANSPSGRSGPARIVIADQHDIVRAGIGQVLSGEPDLQVVGEATNGLEALELCRRSRPDLVLMDVRMPEMDGLAATRAIKQRFPLTSVLILTQSKDHMLEALGAGAAGYILKDSPRSQLVSAVRKTLEGESTLNRRLADELLRRLVSEASEPEKDRRARRAKPPPSLTHRELQVLHLLAQGRPNREIAATLGVRLGTVKNHVQRVIGKLEVSDRTQAVIRAFELNLVAPSLTDRP